MISNSVKMLPLILSLFGALLAFFVIYDRVTRGVVRKFTYLLCARAYLRMKFVVKTPLSKDLKAHGCFMLHIPSLIPAWQFHYVINHFIVGHV